MPEDRIEDLAMTLKDREQRIQTICLLTLSTIFGAAALYWLRPILIPFILALLFLPLTGIVSKVCGRILPDEQDEDDPLHPQYLDYKALDTPTVAERASH